MRRYAVGWIVGLCWWAGIASAQVETTISGVVYDSIGRRPLAGALVQLVRADNPAVSRSIASAADGRFAFPGVGVGSWLLGFFHPVVDSLGLETPMLRVLVNTADPVRAMLTIPSPATVVRSTCGELPGGTGLWYGRVKAASTGSLAPGATVLAQWNALIVEGKTISRRLGTVEDTARVDGMFALCGVGTDETVVARAWLGTDSSGVATITVPSEGLLYRDLWVAPVSISERRIVADPASGDSVVVPVRVGTGSLQGRVARTNGSPVAGARLRLGDAGAEATTNSEGFYALDSLPAGSQTLDVRAIGFLAMTRTVDLSVGERQRFDLVLESRATFLDTVKVIGQRVLEDPRYRDFLQRKKRGFGYFFDEDQIERRQPTFLGDLLRMTPGITILPTAFGGGTIRMRGMGFQAFCAPAVFVDGMLMAQLPGQDIENFINAQDIRGLEVYSRTGSTPVEFQTLNGCGSIVVTTGARRRLPPQ